jgi:hypothetical protein
MFGVGDAIAFVGGAGAILAGITYLLKVALNQAMQRDLVSFKSRLDTEANQTIEMLRSQLRITETTAGKQSIMLLEKRAGLIEELYHKLIDFLRASEGFADIVEWGGNPNKKESAVIWDKAQAALFNFAQINRIYFSADLCEKITGVLRKYSISRRLTRKCASCAELCDDRRVIFLVRTVLRLLGGRGRPDRAIERTRAWSACNWAQQRKPVSAIERSSMRDSPFLRLRRLVEQFRSGVRRALRKPSLAVVVNLITWAVSTGGTPSRGRALALPGALGVLLSMPAAAQGLSASDQPASVAGPPIGPTMMRVVPYPDEMYAVPVVAPAVPYASCYRVGRCSAYDLYRFRDRPNRLTRLAPEAAPESVAGSASIPYLRSLVPTTQEENILPQYRAASQVRDEYRAVGRPIDRPN